MLSSRDILIFSLHQVSIAATALRLISHCIAEVVAVDLPNCSVTESMVQQVRTLSSLIYSLLSPLNRFWNVTMPYKTKGYNHL